MNSVFEQTKFKCLKFKAGIQLCCNLNACF